MFTRNHGISTELCQNVEFEHRKRGDNHNSDFPQIEDAIVPGGYGGSGRATEGHTRQWVALKGFKISYGVRGVRSRIWRALGRYERLNGDMGGH